MTEHANVQRKRTQENLKGPVIEEYITVIDHLIAKQVERGSYCLRSPFNGLRIYNPKLRSWLTNEEETALENHYKAYGYEIKQIPDLDPGNPASTGPYTLLSWK